MSVIQNIRDKGAGIMVALIAITLIAFILMDGLGNRGGGSLSSDIGKVNGKTIDRKEFEDKIALYKQNGQPEQQLREQLWNQEINQALLQEEYDELGLQYTTKELNNYLNSTNPPQWLQGVVSEQNNGQYDPSKVGAALQSLKSVKGEQAERLNNALQATKDEERQKKYFALLEKASFAPQWLVDKQIADANAIANAQFVAVNYSTIADSTVAVSNDEIEAYTQKHSSQFIQKEGARRISYVTFDVQPNGQDSAATLEAVNAQKADFAAATDNKAFLLKNNSGADNRYAAPYEGFYSPKSKVGGGPFTDSIIKMAPGTVYGPFVDNGHYVLAKFVGAKTWADTAKARHILIKTHDQNRQTGQLEPYRNEDDAKKLADSLFGVLKAGGNFDSLVTKFSEDGGSIAKGGVYDKIFQGQMMPEFDNYVFSKPVGSRDIVQTAYGFHIIEVLKQYPGSSPVYSIAFLAKQINASDETRNAASTLADKFAAESKDQKTFTANAAKAQVGGARTSSDIKQSDFAVAGLGESSELINWIYKNDVGDVSDPITIGDKFVVAMVTNVQKAGRMNATTARATAEPLIRNQKKAKIIIDTKFKGNTLEAVAQSSGTGIMRADSISFANGNVPNLGNEPKFVGIAFNKTMTGKVSQPIAGVNAVFMVKPESIGTKDSQTDAAQLRNSLEQQLKNAGNMVTEQLKKLATIKDKRNNN